MSPNTLHLHIDRADGSLQRLIGLVERRGFHIDGLVLRDEGPGRRSADIAPDLGLLGRAGDGNRTRVLSLGS